MLVRQATGTDGDAVADVQERSWQQAYRHIFPADELDRGGFIKPELWRQRLAVPPTGWATFVGEDGDGAVVGFVTVGPSRDERGVGEVYAIYVDPRSWSGGIGRSLLARAEEHLATGYRRATLWVLDDNPRARRFYEKAGWRPDGERKTELRWGIDTLEVRYGKTLTTA
jgi:ribosomal protein S18 acetylase RimI-like enzyme